MSTYALCMFLARTMNILKFRFGFRVFEYFVSCNILILVCALPSKVYFGIDRRFAPVYIEYNVHFNENKCDSCLNVDRSNKSSL